MPRYTEKDYSVKNALDNIGSRFWQIYQNALYEYAKDQSRKDIFERIHREWDEPMKMSPYGTNIRIEWAIAIYNHGDWDKTSAAPVQTSLPAQASKSITSAKTLVDPRRRYPADYRCDNGMYVRSLSELCIANFLYANKITFDYERMVMFGDITVHCDFYLPTRNVYIEFWGMTEDEKYAKYRQWKEPMYAKYGYNLLSLEPNDLKNLRDQLLLKLNK